MTEATSAIPPDGVPHPLPRMLRVDPPASVVKAMGDLKLECGSWRPVEIRPGELPHAMATSSAEASVCDQLTGDRDPAGDAQFFGVVQGVVLAVLVIGAYRLMDAFVRGVCHLVGTRFALGGARHAPPDPKAAMGGTIKD